MTIRALLLTVIFLRGALGVNPASVGRTLWLNASDADHLFTGGTPAAPSGSVGDGSTVAFWTHEDSSTLHGQNVAAPDRPTWHSFAAFANGMLTFDGIQNYFQITDTSNAARPISDFLSSTAYTIFVVFTLSADASNDATIYRNTGAFLDTGANVGIHFKTSAGVSTIYAVNRSGVGTWDTVSTTISQNQLYIAMMRLESSTLYLSLDNGSESSVASGTVNSLVYDTNISYNPQTPNFFPGKIGEILVYNVALTGADLTNTRQYLVDKWETAPPGGPRSSVIQ